MKTRKLKKTWNVQVKLFLVFLVFIMAIFIRYSYIALSKTVDNMNISEFSLNRNTYKKTLFSKRGTIYDKDGNILSINMTSYTVIAYLDENRTKDSNKLMHVSDKESTAKLLSPIINMSEEKILSLLNQQGLYQVELGPGGRNISVLQKEAIEELNLPGIDFIESTKRYYPNGDFASYILGYAKLNKVDGEDIIQGELGIEAYFDSILKGKNGFIEYERDRNGYKIPDTKETKIDALNGEKLDLPIAFDWEIWSGFNNYKLNFNDLNEIAESFIKEINKYNYEGIIYGSAFYINRVWNQNSRTWLAYYTSNNDFEKPYFMWQLSSQGKIDGINGYVDLNVIYLDK